MNAYTRNFQRAVEARIIAEREERMATLRPAAERFEAPEVKAVTRQARKMERYRVETERAHEIRAANPSLTGVEARAAARRALAAEAREEARIAAEERWRTAAQVVALVRDQGMSLRMVAERLGLEDERAAYAEWKWATRRRGGL